MLYIPGVPGQGFAQAFMMCYFAVDEQEFEMCQWKALETSGKPYNANLD
jgi:hypothetical protein